jgi:hypothetical protein
MNRCSDFIMTEGGQRVGHHLHRVSIVDTSCATEGGEPHEPPLAKPSRVYRDDEVPAGFWRALVSRAIATVVLVAICYGAAWVGFTMALPKPAPDLSCAIAKVAP